ncbi:MAG TPA: energy transducer TonB [Candidatus Angelobacter sp.]|nr:energy transducer TonB [Candidatus Angelobacter sp.]
MPETTKQYFYKQLRFLFLPFPLTFTIALMQLSFALLQLCCLIFMSPIAAMAQAAALVQPPKPGPDGVYEVSVSDLKKLDSSPAVEFPREWSAYEVTDTVIIELTLSPEGKVTKAKAISGKIHLLKETTEKTVKKWVFAPYLINGTPVPVRTEIAFNFDHTLDHYRDPGGDLPVRIDQKTAQALVAKRVYPQYPPMARLGGITGAVELRAIVGEDGRVHALHIITGHPLLATAAYNAVRQWEFKPYVENGKTLPVDTNLTVTFSVR